MSAQFVFGYGSLVNRRTHEYQRQFAAQVRGWRRVWQPSPLRPVAYLTAVPDPVGQIEGVIAAVPGKDWAALDLRERAYARHAIVDDDLHHDHTGPVAAAIYAVEQANAPNDSQPILMSYLDVVVQGFFAEFGPEGAARFFATTGGWETPVLDDRPAPRYPRHQQTSMDERAFVDAQLAALSAVVKHLE